jgi:hypothetical protein
MSAALTAEAEHRWLVAVPIPWSEGRVIRDAADSIPPERDMWRAFGKRIGSNLAAVCGPIDRAVAVVDKPATLANKEGVGCVNR